MKTPFSLAQHPHRAQPPLSAPPAGYFDKLPARVMVRVVAPTRQPGWLGGLDRLAWVPAAWRTGLASAVVLSTFGVSFWLSTGLNTASVAVSSVAPAASFASLDAVPREQLLDYLLSADAPLEAADLAANAPHLGLTRQFLRPSAQELTEALDGQPADENIL